MPTLLIKIVLAVLLAVLLQPALAGDSGSSPLAEEDPLTTEPDEGDVADIKKWLDSEPIPRAFTVQPPLIPHAIESYTINKKFNKCLRCHSQVNAADSGATQVSATHFSDRDGTKTVNISARRYFCVQCHIPQTNAKPLIDNTFQPAGR